MFYSPLRYPGGKNKLSSFIAKICIDNKINGHYIEPYSGGASVALFLLFEGFVKKITINDKDRSIYAFWYCVLNKTKQLCEKIENTDITIENWKQQKAIQKNKKKADLFDLGFSTFFLNRTNRSGIINAGAMGGIKQNGNYLLDCRFNKPDLIRRIKNIATRKKDIKLYKKDALLLIDKIQIDAKDENIIFYFDPPYFLKAESLYMNHYKNEHHEKVSEKIKGLRKINWILSYDNVPEIKKLYAGFLSKEFTFKHTAYKIRTGKEILFFSSTISQPQMKNWNPLNFKLKKTKHKNEITYQS